jgi:aryl-alcohol dehydrogenase-like predicted oxidoreductase
MKHPRHSRTQAPRTEGMKAPVSRRLFLSGAAAGAVAWGCSGTDRAQPFSVQPFPEQPPPAQPLPGEPLPAEPGGTPLRKSGADQVLLGSTGIQISRLAMGSGTHGYEGASDQTRLGLEGFSSLLVSGYDRGITFWETADQYGAHPHVARALGTVGRQNVVVLTKTHARTESEMQADLERFMRELGTDYIDIVLLHNRQSGSWDSECAGAMSYLADAKARGLIRAHGVSCHTLEALRVAARTPWVDVDLARINPAGLHMDADPATVTSVLKEMKAAGKGVIGMKILGQGDLSNSVESAIQHATRLDCLDGFTIGFRSTSEIEDVQVKIEAA